MFTENSIKALLLIAEGFKTLAESIAVGGELLPVVEETTEKAVEAEASEEAEAEEEADAEEAPEAEEEDLESLSYNELKKRAKEAGVSATGNRKELIEKIRNAGSEESEPEAEEEPQEEKKPVASKKPVKKVEEPEDDEPEDEEDSEEDEAEEPTTQELVEEAVADMSDDDLREILEDAELSTKGKRSALISRIVTAVDEGVITLGDDEDDESEAEGEDEEPAEEAGDDITADMTPERKEAYETLCEETEESFNDGEITRDDLIDFLAEFNGITSKKAKTQYKDTEDADLLVEYLTAMSLLVSDEGEVVEEGAYTINDVAYCCGHELAYDEKSETYKCEICGAEYDAE